MFEQLLQTLKILQMCINRNEGTSIFTLSMLQSKILSTIEEAYGFHASSGSPLFRYANRASSVIFVLGATKEKNNEITMIYHLQC